jgi:alpha-D-xyloside xylohydrolase
VDYYLPPGRWTNFLTGQTVGGGRWLRETHDFLSLPLMVRPNSVIAVGSQDERPDYDYTDGVTLQAYELADGQPVTVVVPAPDGSPAVTFGVKREGDIIAVDRQGAAERWRLLLVGIEAVTSVEGGAVESSPQGALVIPRPGVDHLEIRLPVHSRPI